MKNLSDSAGVDGQKLSNNLVASLFFGGLILLLISGYFLWSQVISSPRNVFNSMLESSLKTRSVAKHTTQASGGQSLDQTTLLQANQYNTAQSLTTLKQQGEGNGATVKTESLGTPLSDYVRYTEITTEQTDSEGNPLNFGNVINVWGRSGGLANQTGELYGETVLGIVPIGYVDAEKRAELLDHIEEKRVYEVDYAKVRKESFDGRSSYVYPVKVSPEGYIDLLKRFSEAVGLRHLEDLDPAQFANSPPLNVEITVDVISHQLVEVTYVDTGRVERLSAYGSWVPQTLPNIEDTITIEELQMRLQNVE